MLYLGEGDKTDMNDTHVLKVGGYHFLPAKAHHYAFTKAASAIQIHAMSHWIVTYINEKDDPQRMVKK